MFFLFIEIVQEAHPFSFDDTLWSNDYRPPTKVRESKVFTGDCQSFCSGGR